jgi:hypothetical protein
VQGQNKACQAFAAFEVVMLPSIMRNETPHLLVRLYEGHETVKKGHF